MNTMLNPWNLLDELLDADGRMLGRLHARAAGLFPPVNVYLDDHALIVDLELPGKTAKDIDLTLESQAIVISDRPAAKADTETGKTLDTPPAWSRRLNLPFRVDAQKANAHFSDGILRVSLPKAEEANVRHIAIAE